MKLAGRLSVILIAAFAAQADGLWLDVPFVRQVENGCGSAVLSMILQYWSQHGTAVSPKVADAEQIQKELYSAELHGILASAMQSYLESHGFQIVVFRGRWGDLGEHVAKGRPLIAGFESGGTAHYVVVAGWSEDAVEVNDPADRKLRKMGRAEFEKKWRAAGNWTLLAVPRSGF